MASRSGRAAEQNDDEQHDGAEQSAPPTAAAARSAAQPDDTPPLGSIHVPGHPPGGPAVTGPNVLIAEES